MEAEKARGSGSWRDGEFVRWQDLFAPVEGLIVWIGLLSLSIGAAMAINRRIGHPSASVLHFAQTAGKDFNSTQIMVASMDLVILFFMWRIARRVTECALIARYRPIGWPAFLSAFVGGMLLAAATMFAIQELARHSMVEFRVNPAERSLMPRSSADLPLAMLGMVTVAPFAEEFYFRGMLLSWLQSRMLAPLAALLSAALFALLHFRFVSHPGTDGWVYTGTIGLVGLVNAALALRTRSLWGPFALHAGYNATLAFATVLPPLLSG